MDNKAIIEEVINAFDTNDVTSLLNYVTDDVVWEMRDQKDMVISGKENLRNFFSEYNEMKMIRSTRDHIIIDGNQIAVDGTVTMEGKDAEQFEMFYCDIYELTDNKVSKIISYPIKKI
ncbi:nuclear transport factor 2 family protein [Pedobacter immunditicola]|uniref:nuclear transport factor 2 family protein n=1 Tax=Pedobacter immunditicola TaxID=3133440 RepID=UPI0030B3DFE9